MFFPQGRMEEPQMLLPNSADQESFGQNLFPP